MLIIAHEDVLVFQPARPTAAVRVAPTGGRKR
jgi:hypothetical protein